MMLSELISALNYRKIDGEAEKEIKGIAYDSRRVSPGFLFVAIKGQRVDGDLFINQAIKKGAVAVASENPPDKSRRGISWVMVENSRKALALAAGNFFQHPSRQLKLIGITGTNGKTTVSYLVHSILQAAGIKCGRLGTISYHLGDKEIDAKLTTPEALEIQQYLRQMSDAGCNSCVMEVSSHSLALHRVAGCEFDMAIFTNLAREHLDFHHDMEEYFNAKKQLFYMLNNNPDGTAIINLDDPRGKELMKLSRVRNISFAVQERADIKARKFHLSSAGNQLQMETPIGNLTVKSPLIGKPNISNMLAATAVAVGLGIDIESIKQGIESLSQIPGRFEKIEVGQDFTVINDFAHSGDALKRLLQSIQQISQGRIITIFGCGGERDKGKRPLMGYHAVKLSDIAIVTSDNPRSEHPMKIIQEIEEGIQQANSRGEYMIIPDRGEALRKAIEIAQTGDTVVIAGKGHESYQIIGDKALPWSDKEIAKQLILEKMDK